MATTITKTKLVSIFPQFANVAEARVTAVNPYAAHYVDADTFGDREEYGQLLMVAHIIALGDQRGSGPLTATKVGDLARSYANPATQEWLGQTSYGVEFLNLVNTAVVPCTISNVVGEVS